LTRQKTLPAQREPVYHVPAHTGDMVVYYCSYFNLGAALPLMFLLLFTHQIYYLFAGILINIIIFWLAPSLHALLLGRVGGFKGVSAFGHYAIIGIAFLGHGYSMMRGFFAYLSDKLIDRYEPFGATSVDEVEHSFKLGIRILGGYYRKNLPALIASLLIIVGCLSVLQDIPPHIIRPFIVFFLMAYVLAPVALTPQLFAAPTLSRHQVLRPGSTRRPAGGLSASSPGSNTWLSDPSSRISQSSELCELVETE
jgi:hypothetical protein